MYANITQTALFNKLEKQSWANYLMHASKQNTILKITLPRSFIISFWIPFGDPLNFSGKENKNSGEDTEKAQENVVK